MTPSAVSTATAVARFVEVEEGGVTWRIDGEWSEVILTEVVRRLPAISRGGEVIKQNRMRTVYRVPLEGRRHAHVYLKVHRAPTPFERAKSLVLPSRAATEWRLMTLFREAGIPTARPLARAERRVHGVLREAYFITEAISGASDLVPFLKRAFPGPVRGRARASRREFLGRLALYVREMHDRGLYYSDLHSGNVLVTGEEPGEASLHFIDLHTGRERARLDFKTRLKNLTRLSHSLLEVTGRADRLRFLLDYAGGDAALGHRLRRVFSRAEARLTRLERRRLRSRGSRCITESSRFTRLFSARHGMRGYAQRRFPEAFWHEVVAAHGRASAGDGGRLLKDGRSTRVTALAIGDGPAGPERVCVKEYRCPSVFDRLKRALGYSKARRAWLAGNALAVRGVPVAEPLALLRGAGQGRSDLLVMRDVSDLPRLDHLVFERYPDAARRPQPGRWELARRVASYASDLHRRGVYHNDLKACNVLVSGGARGASFVLIDYDGARCFPRPVDLRRRIKNLAQLSASIPTSISNTERCRFFRAYSEGRLSRTDRRRYYRGVIEACRVKTVVKERPIE